MRFCSYIISYSLPAALLLATPAIASGEITYTNPRAQAVGKLLEILATENNQENSKLELNEEQIELLKEEEKPDPYRKPKVLPVEAAPRILEEPAKPKTNPTANSVNKGGIGNVGGIGAVGSPNVKAF